jgi:hypothetical protein
MSMAPQTTSFHVLTWVMAPTHDNLSIQFSLWMAHMLSLHLSQCMRQVLLLNILAKESMENQQQKSIFCSMKPQDIVHIWEG